MRSHEYEESCRLKRKITFPLQSHPRIYGRSGIFTKIVNDIRYILLSDRDFQSWFLRQNLIKTVGAPQHMVGQALDYLISEGFVEGPIPAPKDQMFSLSFSGHSGVLLWDKILNGWVFEYSFYNCNHNRMPKLTGRCRLCKATFPSKSPKKRPHVFHHRSNRKQILLPQDTWDGMAYCVDDESAAYKEFEEYMKMIREDRFCSECNRVLQPDRKHSPEECKLNMIRDIMTS